MPNLTAFFSYVIVTTFTPGPNTIMSMSNAAKYGFKKSLPFIFGVFAGFITILALSGIFSLSLYKIVPSIKPIMTTIGAVYILYLAWKIYKSEPNTDNDYEKTTNTFISGMLLQFVNIKGILFCLTTLSTFIIPYYRSVFEIILFCIAISFVALISNLCWSLFGSLFQRFIRKNNKMINTIMALLLVYCAVSLFL